MSGLVQVNYHRISHFVETKQRHVNLKHKSKNHKIPSWASCEKEAPPPSLALPNVIWLSLEQNWAENSLKHFPCSFVRVTQKGL